MKKIIKFSKVFLPAAILSALIVIAGVTGFLLKGFNLGVDFQAGLIQEVQFAPTAFTLRWLGASSALFSFDRNNIYIVVSGSGIENRTYSYSFLEYNTIGSLRSAMSRQMEDIEITLAANGNTSSNFLLFSTQGNTYLGNDPYVVHYLQPGSDPIDIVTVRNAMAEIQGVSVQNMGQPEERHFMIRAEDKEENRITSEKITTVLETYFGKGEVVILRSDYVGSRFSKDLTDQAGILVGLTLLLILIYASIRFKPQYAAGAVIAIIHDGIVIVSFIVWTRMEFNTSTIAAILTILGYSINNTIVVYDRIRENVKMFPDDHFVDILDRSLTGVLSRSIITTFTTMLAVISLFVFTTGSMKDFALALLVGMISGIYTSLLIATGFINLWEMIRQRKAKSLRN
jgi:preprotein translocase subunit SecF